MFNLGIYSGIRRGANLLIRLINNIGLMILSILYRGLYDLYRIDGERDGRYFGNFLMTDVRYIAITIYLNGVVDRRAFL